MKTGNFFCCYLKYNRNVYLFKIVQKILNQDNNIFENMRDCYEYR